MTLCVDFNSTCWHRTVPPATGPSDKGRRSSLQTHLTDRTIVTLEAPSAPRPLPLLHFHAAVDSQFSVQDNPSIIKCWKAVMCYWLQVCGVACLSLGRCIPPLDIEQPVPGAHLSYEAASSIPSSDKICTNCSFVIWKGLLLLLSKWQATYVKNAIYHLRQ